MVNVEHHTLSSALRPPGSCRSVWGEQPNNHNRHHHKRPKQRSVSRSSSSPSPPPTPKSSNNNHHHGSHAHLSSASSGIKEKRRSFHTNRPSGTPKPRTGSTGALSSGASSLRSRPSSWGNGGHDALDGPGPGPSGLRSQHIQSGSKSPSNSSSDSSRGRTRLSKVTHQPLGTLSIPDMSNHSDEHHLPTIAASPLTPWEERGFSTAAFGTSASSRAAAGTSSDGGDYFVGVVDDETEVEDERRARAGQSWLSRGREDTRVVGEPESLNIQGVDM
jgi:hypothetical protein